MVGLSYLGYWDFGLLFVFVFVGFIWWFWFWVYLFGVVGDLGV
jgi:hypothetical protein